MSELELYLDLALEKVTWAIGQTSDNKQKHMFIDTKAEILWKLNRIDEAILEIEKCTTFDPNNIYYKEFYVFQAMDLPHFQRLCEVYTSY